MASSMAEAIAAPTAGDAALARALDAERIERARRILGQHDVDVGHLARGRHEIVGEGDGQRIAALVVGEFLQQRPAQSLREPADDLPFTSIGLIARPMS